MSRVLDLGLVRFVAVGQEQDHVCARSLVGEVWWEMKVR